MEQMMHGAYRANDPETSKEAAQFDVTRLEGEVYAILKTRPSTTEEIAAIMGRPLQSITPRIAPAGKATSPRGMSSNVCSIDRL